MGGCSTAGAEHQIAFFSRELTSAEPGRRAAAVKGLGRLGQRLGERFGRRDEHTEAVVRAARDTEAVVRAGAADALGRLGGDGSDTVMVELMGDPDPSVRRRASLAAERLGLTGPAVTEAFRRLLEDDDWHLRLNALLALGSRGETVEPAVLVRLLGDRGPYLWGPARSALYASLHKKPVLELLLHTARHGHGLARVRALDLLPRQHIRGLRDTFLDGLHDECPAVRRAVVGHLAGDLSHGPADTLLSPLGLSGAVDTFFSALRRSGAVESLLPVLRPSATADALLSALDTETDSDVAARLLDVLGRWGDVRAVPAAVRWLDHPRAGTTAVEALADIGTPTAVRWIRAAAVSGPGPDLGPGLGRPDVRKAAATALGGLAAPDATETLLPLLHDADERVRAGALQGLGRLGEHGLPRPERRAAADALLAHLTTDEPNLWHTRHALSEYPETLPAVRRLITHPSDEVRATVLALLDEDDDADVALLLSHLDDPSEPVRHEALRGIGRYVDGYGELPDTPPGTPHDSDLLDVITALSQPPSSQQIRYTARLILDELKET